jgi:hypothetical protein
MDFLRALWTGGMRPDDSARHDLQRTLLAALKRQHLVIEQAFA